MSGGATSSPHRLALAEIEAMRLSPLLKGVPAGTDALLRDVGSMGWNVLREDLPLPVAVIRRSALDRNRGWMQRFLAETGVALAPHGKTTMSPQLFDRQLADGAWGLTAATPGHVQIYRHFGVRRVLLANQLVGRAAIDYVLDELAADPEFDFYCLVDSAEAASTLAAAVRVRERGRPLQVLVEIGIDGGRTGVRDPDAALALARHVAGLAPWLALRGIECFEGVAAMSADTSAESAVRRLLDRVVSLARAAQGEHLFAPGAIILSAGGSAHFDIVVERFAKSGLPDALTVLRAGCYISHDSQLYARFFAELEARRSHDQSSGPGLTAALEVWGYVQSLPEPALAILTFGKRDVSHDVHLPVPQWHHRPARGGRPQPLDGSYRIRALNDQHAYVELPVGHGWQIGDMVGVGVSHPCTTFDKWQLLFEIDDDYTVVGAIRTYF